MRPPPSLSERPSPLKAGVAYALLYSLVFSHIYYYADTGLLPLHSLFSLSSRAHPVLLGALLIPLSAFIVLRKESLSRGLFLPLCLLILTGYLAVVVAYYAVTLNAHRHVDDQYILRSMAALLRYAIYFAAGYYLPTLLRSRDTIRAFAVLYSLVVIHIVIHLDPTIPSMDFSYLSERVDSLRNYQFYADTFALFTFIVVATRVRRRSRTIVVLIATVCLFLLISRAAFYAYVLVGAVILFDQYKGSVRRYLYPVLYLVLTYWALISPPAAVQTESRIAGTFAGDLANSASTLGRVLMLQRGLQHLFNESWLLGDFRAHYKIFATPGTYIHNYLSLWADYGVVPFAAFVALLLGSLLYIPRARKLGERLPSSRPLADVFKYALAFNTILALGARAHFFPYVFFSFGMLFALREAIPSGVYPLLRPLTGATGVTPQRLRYL